MKERRLADEGTNKLLRMLAIFKRSAAEAVTALDSSFYAASHKLCIVLRLWNHLNFLCYGENFCVLLTERN